MSKRLIVCCVLFIVVCLVGCTQAIEGISVEEKTRLEDPYQYIKALIESFGWAKSALSRMEVYKWDATKIEGVTKMMLDLKKAGIEYEEAATAVADFQQSKNEAIGVSAEWAYSAYVGVIEVDKQFLVEVEKLLRGDSESLDSGRLMRRMTDLAVARDQAWRLLFWATVTATHSLVERPERKSGLLSKLNVTVRQRTELILALEKAFGDSIKGVPKAGQESLVAAAALLHHFLSDQKWASSDSE